MIFFWQIKTYAYTYSKGSQKLLSNGKKIKTSVTKDRKWLSKDHVTSTWKSNTKQLSV